MAKADWLIPLAIAGVIAVGAYIFIVNKGGMEGFSFDISGSLKRAIQAGVPPPAVEAIAKSPTPPEVKKEQLATAEAIAKSPAPPEVKTAQIKNLIVSTNNAYFGNSNRGYY